MKIFGAFALLFLACHLLCQMGRRSCNFSRRRPPKEMDELYRDFGCKTLVAFEDFQKIMELIGESYLMDPKRLLPSDTFESLGKMETWTLGAGDDLVEYAKKKDVEIEDIQSVRTLRDYVILVGASHAH